jgi:hypothetical protein
MSSPRPPDPWPSTPEGRSSEPEPDDEETGPINVSTPSTSFDSARDSGRDSLLIDFDALFKANTRKESRERKRIVLLGAVGLVVVAVAGLAFWLLRPMPATSDSPSANSAASTTPVSTPSDADAQARLVRLLPPGYAPGSCKPVAPPKDALARISCGKNSDPGAPSSATYTLVPDEAALRVAFDGIVHASTIVNCPRNIQSPGPWRRNATPQQISGMLVCGFQQNLPTVAWTTDAERLVSVVQADQRGPTLDQLYTWWSTHS